MKKLILLTSFLILITGCANKEKTFEKYAKEYYEKHMRIVNNVDEVTITLEDLKNASSEDDYNLDKFKKCDNQSKITFNLDKQTKEIKNKIIELNC